MAAHKVLYTALIMFVLLLVYALATWVITTIVSMGVIGGSIFAAMTVVVGFIVNKHAS